jgi:hypothetical protein
MQTTGMIKDGQYESTAKGFDAGFYKERNIWDRRYTVVDEEIGVVQAVIVNRPDEKSTGWVPEYGPDRAKFQRE